MSRSYGSYCETTKKNHLFSCVCRMKCLQIHLYVLHLWIGLEVIHLLQWISSKYNLFSCMSYKYSTLILGLGCGWHHAAFGMHRQWKNNGQKDSSFMLAPFRAGVNVISYPILSWVFVWGILDFSIFNFVALPWISWSCHCLQVLNLLVDL